VPDWFRALARVLGPEAAQMDGEVLWREDEEEDEDEDEAIQLENHRQRQAWPYYPRCPYAATDRQDKGWRTNQAQRRPRKPATSAVRRSRSHGVA